MEIQMDGMGIGVDIENVDRFAGSDFVRNSTFANAIFTQNEQDYCFLYQNAAPHLAVRYCAKEAVTKALATFGLNGIDYTDIEIYRERGGRPTARIDRNEADGLQVFLSLSHCEEKAVAFAIIIQPNL